MNYPRHFTTGRSILAGVLLAFVAVLMYGSYQVGSYYSHLDEFSGHIARGDISAARAEYEKIDEFYKENEELASFHLAWVAKKYLFQNANIHRAAFYYIEGAYGDVVKELQGAEGYWPAYLRGNAYWRRAQAIYANGTRLSDPKLSRAQKDEAEKIVDDSVKEEYETAVKNDPHQTVAPKWNYDLITDPGARGRGLQPKGPKVKVMLGQVPGGGGTPNDGKKNPGKTGEDGDGKGTKDLDKKGKGPADGGKPKKIG